jgi:photosystem II stability/assembly factor-like uncharacterized protein
MMKLVTRKRAIIAGIVAAFLAAFAALGALSSSKAPAVVITAAAPAPYSPWYWTMVVSPTDPNVVLLATSSGVFRSADGAKTWKPVGPKNVNTTSIVQAGTSMFMGGVPGPNPVIRKGTGRTAPDGKGVFASSADEGKTWKVLHPAGLPVATIQALAVDPASASTIWALLNDGRLYRSTNGAKSFAMQSRKIGAPPWALAVTQNGQFVAGDMDRGGFHSTNGKTWTKTPFTDSRGGSMVMEYAVQPTDATHVLMTSVGIEISTDGGKTWHQALKSSVMFGPVAWAPNAAKVAYAVGFDRSFWRSDDGGATWAKVT